MVAQNSAIKIQDQQEEDDDSSSDDSDREEQTKQRVKYRRRNCAPKLKTINPEKYEMVKLKRQLQHYTNQKQKLAHLRKFYQIDKVKANRCCLCCLRWTISKKNNTMKTLFFNGALLIVLESVCQFAISAYLYWMRPSQEFAEDTITYIGQLITSYFCLICLAVVTLLSILIIFIDEEWLMQKPVRRKMIMLYEFQRLSDKPSKAFTFLFIMRRVNIVAVSFLWQKFSGVQVIAMVVQNQLFVIYVGLFTPMRTRQMNKLEFFNEFSIDMVTLHLVLYTNFCHNQYTKYNAGYSMIILVLINILYNLFGPFMNLMNGIRLRIKRLWIRIPYWYDNIWAIAMQSEYDWIAENAIILWAAYLAWIAQMERNKNDEVKIKSKLEIIQENRKQLSFADLGYLVGDQDLDDESIQVLQAIFTNLKENEDELRQLRKKTFFIRRRIYMDSIRIMFPRKNIVEIYKLAQDLKQLFPSERSRLFFEKNAFDYLTRQFKSRFMKEKYDLYLKELSNGMMANHKVDDFEEFSFLNRQEAQREFFELMEGYFTEPYEDFLNKYQEDGIDLTDPVIHDGICKQITNRHINIELLPVFEQNPSKKPIDLMPHHLFQIIYPKEHVQTFELRMFDMRDKLYDQLSDQVRQNADIDQLEDIFTQVVKNNDTKYDSVKWSLKQLNEIGQLDRADRTQALQKLFDDYRFGNTQMQRYQKVQISMQQLYYFLNEYHTAEVAFLEEQEQKIFSSMTIPVQEQIMDDEENSQLELVFCTRLLDMIRNTEVGEFTWNTNFLKQEIIK